MKLWHMNFMLCIYTPDEMYIYAVTQALLPDEMYSFSYTSSITRWDVFIQLHKLYYRMRCIHSVTQALLPDEVYSFSYTSSITRWDVSIQLHKLYYQLRCIHSVTQALLKSVLKNLKFSLNDTVLWKAAYITNINYLNPLLLSLNTCHTQCDGQNTECQLLPAQNMATPMQHFKFQSAGDFRRSHWAFHSGARGWSITNCENYFHSTWYASLPSMQ
jgi:hypothetical protein